MPRINVKLNDESFAIIEKYLDEHKMTKNQLIKNALGMYIALTGSSKIFLEANPVAVDFFKGIKKIVNSKEYKRQTNQLLEKLSKKYSKEELESFGLVFEEIENRKMIVEKKNESGRKKKPKRKPGRRPMYE